MRRPVWTRKAIVRGLVLAVVLAMWTPAGSGQFLRNLFRRATNGGPVPQSSEPLLIEVLDIGQGDSILIRSPEGRTALIDAGPSRRVVDRLDERGISQLDLIVVTHPHTDHFGGMDDVIDAFRPRYFLAAETEHATSSYLKLLKHVRAAGITTVLANDQGRKINLGSVVLTVLPQPPIDEKDQNNNSVGIRLQYGNFAMLLTGDSEEAARASWMVNCPDLLRDCQILKLAHHGSHNGTDERWLELVHPEAAVVSCGRGNSFGHPHPETLHLLAKANIPLYRTDELGTITIRSDGRQWDIDRQDAYASADDADTGVRRASDRALASPTDDEETAPTTARAARSGSSRKTVVAGTASGTTRGRASTRAPGARPAAVPDPEDLRIDLNTATRTQLERIPGVGPATARRIMQGRPFDSLDQVEELGISSAAMAEIRKRASVR